MLNKKKTNKINDLRCFAPKSLWFLYFTFVFALHFPHSDLDYCNYDDLLLLFYFKLWLWPPDELLILWEAASLPQDHLFQTKSNSGERWDQCLMWGFNYPADDLHNVIPPELTVLHEELVSVASCLSQFLQCELAVSGALSYSFAL